MNCSSDNVRWVSIILAAGESRRLGYPKQLIEIEGVTLIERLIRASISSGADETVVVLGASAGKIRNTIRRLPVSVICNERWRDGISSSVRYGVTYALTLNPPVEFAMILPCDQPELSADHLKKMGTKLIDSGKSICASAYGGTLGIPCAFRRSELARLLTLTGNRGAAQVFAGRESDIESIDFPDGIYDIDTLSDLRRYGITTAKHSNDAD